ncbi:MAG TPA: fused MFS/spermidine synthase [Thermoanaerobaculia bacterium]|jgi:predicted membrane-bound spermidine synthase
MSLSERLSVRVAVFASGALLMALEVAAFRIIGKTFGSALRETTTVIAVFLAAMAVGYWAGGRVADRRPLSSTLAGTLLSAAATVLLVPWADALLSPLVARSGLAMETHAFIVTTLLFAVPTVLFAATSPIAIRLFATTTGESGSTAGGISALSTTGSIFGSLVTAFFLIDWLESITRTVLFVSLGAGATALLIVLASQASRGRRPLAFASAVAVAVLTVAFVRSTTADRTFTAGGVHGTVVYAGDSPYHRVTVLDRGPFRELYFNVAKQGRMRRADPHGPGLPSSDTYHITPLLRPGVRRVLVIGLGGGTAAKQFTRFYPEAVVDAVEVDPLVADVARRFFEVKPGPNLRVHVADGRTFLKRSNEKWDLVIVDAYTTNSYGDTVAAHMVTREFFGEVAEHLTPNGVVHFHCAFATSPLLPAIQETLRAVFPSVLRTKGELLASSVPLVLDREALAARAKASPAAHLPTLQEAIAELTPERLPGKAPILTDDYAPVDTLIYQKR